MCSYKPEEKETRYVWGDGNIIKPTAYANLVLKEHKQLSALSMYDRE